MAISYSLLDRIITIKGRELESLVKLGDGESFFKYIAQIMHDSNIDTSRDCEYLNEGENNINLPFVGGLVGYFGYEMKSETLNYVGNHKPFKTNSSKTTPDSFFIFADRVIAFDHLEQKIYLLALVNRNDDKSINQDLQQQWILDMERSIENLKEIKLPNVEIEPSLNDSHGMKLAHDKDSYIRNIQTSLDKIEQGETYEVCLTTQFAGKLKKDAPSPFLMYRHLRKRNPAPYAAYMSLGPGLVITSSSPERYLRVESKNIVTMKPIKGTLKTATTQNFSGTNAECVQENLKRRNDLATSEKDRSENLMIVDLIRNDLNQIADSNSVKVPKLMEVESYSTVHQLVSTVEASVKDELGPVDALMRCFPPGSMTGAPKLRTVQILEDLEEIPRGVYSGTIGYFSVDKRCDFSVVIRTAVFEKSNMKLN